MCLCVCPDSMEKCIWDRVGCSQIKQKNIHGVTHCIFINKKSCIYTEIYISNNVLHFPPFNPYRTVTARTGQSIAILEWAVSLEIKPKVNLLFLLAGVCCDGGR